MLSLNWPVLSVLQYADDLVLMSEIIEGLKNELTKWKEVFESMGLKVMFEKTKVMVSGDIKMMACLKVKLTHVGYAA